LREANKYEAEQLIQTANLTRMAYHAKSSDFKNMIRPIQNSLKELAGGNKELQDLTLDNASDFEIEVVKEDGT